jgi:hydroxypyruvate reductase
MPESAALLQRLFHAAVAAASPANCMRPALSRLPDREYIVVGAGKAAAAMAHEVASHFPGKTRGMVIVPYGHALDCGAIEVVEAAHPVPDEAGIQAARRLLKMVSGLAADDHVLCLISGGASSLLTMPADGLTLGHKQAVTAALLTCGAPIEDVNCVRKHLSAIKGGRLAVACAPARLTTLAISDVPGNDVSVIGSGPTVADSTTAADAMDILRHYDIRRPATVLEYLQLEHDDTDPLPPSDVHVLATADDALHAARRLAESQGIQVLVLGDLAGDARQLAKRHASLALKIAAGNGPVAVPGVVLSGGETTVRVTGTGRGGRNGEYALQLMLSLDGDPAISALACDTDGVDGTGDNAGCLVFPDSLRRCRDKGLDAHAAQAANDSYRVFAALDDLVMTGPTLTNVNDFRAILVGNCL